MTLTHNDVKRTIYYLDRSENVVELIRDKNMRAVEINRDGKWYIATQYVDKFEKWITDKEEEVNFSTILRLRKKVNNKKYA